MKKLFCILTVCLLQFACGQFNEPVNEQGKQYTCPMHSTVRTNKPGSCPVCNMTLVEVKAGPQKNETTQQAIQIPKQQQVSANIATEEVKRKNIAKEIILTGTMAADERKVEVVTAWNSGRIEKLYVRNPGEEIRKGQKIFDLYSEQLLSAEKEYLLAFKEKKELPAKSEYDNILLSAKNKLLLWGLSEAQLDELEKTENISTTISIYSKRGGVITEINVREGQYISEGMLLYKLAELQSLWVEAQLYTNELGYLQQHPKIIVEPEAFPNEKITGEPVYDNPVIEPNSKINLVRVKIQNPQLKYKPGMMAYIHLQLKEKEALVIPKSALVVTSKMISAWIQQEEEIFESRMVKTGIENKNEVEILSGLSQGEKVVVSGAYLLNSEFIIRKGANPMQEHQH